MEIIELTSIQDTERVEERIKNINPLSKGVVVFGSARIQESHHYYQEARELALSLARSRYFVITGGGPGIMEAANKGTKEGGGFSVGLHIKLEKEENPNPFLDIELHFEEFWLRKFFFERMAFGFVIFPGGFGTLDELFEVLVLMQTNKRSKRPIVLYGKEFWNPLLEFFKQSLIKEHCIDPKELALIEVVDSVGEIIERFS